MIENMSMKPTQFILGSAVLLLIGIAGYLGITFALFAYSPARAPNAAEGEKSSIIIIKKGMGQSEIARSLVNAQVLTDAKSFILLGKITKKWPSVKQGEYRFTSSMSPMDIFQILNSGVSINHPITVREGQNIYEIAAEVEAKGLGTKEAFLTLCKSPPFIQSLSLGDPSPKTLEGYLYPETYFFSRSQTLPEMIQQMVKRFHIIWLPEHEAQAKVLNLTKHQIVTLASIIEKETAATSERALISSVFHNRLKKGMRLQSDPTTIYGIWERYKGNIHRSDLLDKNPFNTYSVAGLPVGPISNPGLEAIKAALYPVESSFLFFVSHNDGTHEFTKSLADHQKAVLKFQIDKKAREGKSWRDLYKTPQNKSEQKN
jgi:UPF0755 protein